MLTRNDEYSPFNPPSTGLQNNVATQNSAVDRNTVKFKPPVFILGVHRSGTSLLTRIIEALGIFVGNDLQSDHESLSVIALNNAYFNATESSWDQPRIPASKELASNLIKRYFTSNAGRFFNSFGQPSDRWAIKDPRLLVTLPLWRDLMGQSPAVIIRRNPIAIAKSLSIRHQQHLAAGIFPDEPIFYKGNIKFTQRCATLDGALSFAHEQILLLDKLIASGLCRHRLELSYEGLCADPAFEIWNLCRFLNLSPNMEQVRKAVGLPEATPEISSLNREYANTLFNLGHRKSV